MICGIIADLAASPHREAIERLLQQSVDRTDDTDLPSVLRAILTGRAQLWAVIDDGPQLVAVTELLALKGGKQAFCWQMAGDFDRFGAVMVEAFEAWARGEGCNSVEVNGRMGWIRKLRDYRAVACTLRKEL